MLSCIICRLILTVAFQFIRQDRLMQMNFRHWRTVTMLVRFQWDQLCHHLVVVALHKDSCSQRIRCWQNLPRKSQPKPIIGCLPSNTLLSSVNTTRQIDMFVSRLHTVVLPFPFPPSFPFPPLPFPPLPSPLLTFPPIIGCSPSNTLLSSVNTTRQIDMFVSRLHTSAFNIS